MDINKIKSQLEEEGFRPTIDSDGDVVFKFEGGVYFIAVDENDEMYVRIAFPNFWKVESKDEEKKGIRCAHDATKRVKGAKIFLSQDDFWGTVELFLPSENDLNRVLVRSLEAIQGAVRVFVNGMKAAD